VYREGPRRRTTSPKLTFTLPHFFLGRTKMNICLRVLQFDLLCVGHGGGDSMPNSFV
jgi:hypothetical protein